MRQGRRAALIQFLKFGIVGLSNTAVSLLIYYGFLWLNADWYLWGNAVGWVVGVANSYFWNHRYVFATSASGWRAEGKRIGRTYLSYGATLGLSQGLLYLEVDILAFSPGLCPLLNLLVTVPLNFLLNKFWAFR